MAEGAQAAVLIDENGNFVGIVLDGSVYRVQTTGKVQNTSGTAVDPATEGKLEAVRALLATIDADTSNLDVALSTRATEATQATLGLETTQDAIRDNIGEAVASPAANTLLDRLKSVWTSLNDINLVTGIKKIVDALPVGDNWIGRMKVGDGTNIAELQSINGVQHLAAGKANIIDTANSTTSQLAADNEFAPSGTDVSQFSSIAITLHSDQDSAEDGMKFEFSMDGTNWDDVYSFNLEASSSQTRRFQFPVCAQYFRVHYINGSTTTTELRIQTLLQRNNILTSIHRIEDAVKEDRSAQIVKSAIIAQREGATVQTFHPIQADISGNLKVTTIGTDVPSDPGALVLEFCKNGGSENLLVDGSVTPVNFDIGPTTTDEVWSLREILLTFAADDFSFDGDSFGPISKMTNGLDIEIVKNSVTTSVFMVYQNEDFLRVPGRTPLVNNTGPKDILGAAIAFQGLVLEQATGDVVRVKVQDDLTSVKLQYFTATVFAVKVL